MFTPLLAVVAVGLAYSDSIKEVLRYYGLRIKGVKVVHVLTSLAIPLTIYLVGAAYAVVAGIQLVNPAEYLIKSGLLPAEADPNAVSASLLVRAVLYGVSINAFFALGEEIGWRGLMQVELGRRLTPYAVPALTGVIWSLWHAPLILLYGYNYPTHRDLLGISTYAVICILWSYLLYEVRSWSNSVIPAAVLHGTINSVAGLSLITTHP